MKKEILLISEKHERTTIRYRGSQKICSAICESCGKEVESLTVNELADLIGIDAKYIRNNLKILRRNKK